MEAKYIDVKEFSAAVGQSFQSIYKRIQSGKLNDYITKINGKIYIDRGAIDLFNSPSFSNGGIETKNRNVERKGEQIESLQIQIANEKAKSDSLFQQISTLEFEKKNLLEDLQDKKEQIERLKKELDEARAKIEKKEEQIENMTARLLTMAENQQELIRNSQILVAQAQQKRGFLARLFAPKEQKENV